MPDAIRERARYRPPMRGEWTASPHGRRVSIMLSHEIISAINIIAERESRSFAAVAREVIKTGMNVRIQRRNAKEERENA